MSSKVSDCMNLTEKLIDFAVCLGMPDCGEVSLTNRFIVKPVNWLIGQEKTGKISQFICRHFIARIVSVAASAFAALDMVYNTLACLVKLPLAGLKAARVKHIPSSCSFQGILENLQNLGQSLLLTATASITGVIMPEKLSKMAYPTSAYHKAPIFGYHEVSPKITDPWTISPQLFEQQLEHLYQHNYELCTFREFLEGYTPPKGKKLAVITFDDSHESQFRVEGIDKNGELIVDQNCAIGVFEKLRKKYPDFRCTATFYVNTSEDKGSTGGKDHVLFANNPKQKPYTAQKLKYLIDHGYEIGSHGHFHTRFDKLSMKELQQDITRFDEEIEKIKTEGQKQGIDLKDLEIVSFAWPHGMIPSKKKRQVIDSRYKYIADYGFNSSKVQQKSFLQNPKKCKTVPRIYIGPNTGFEQFVP